MNECIISVELSADGHFQGRIAGPYDDVHSGIQRLKELLPESIQDEQSIQYSFWRSHTLGARETRRNLFVPGWEDIEANYALKTRASLTGLMGRDEPINSGGLMLWHGLPGTGKSYAVRALSWEWRSWSRFNYVLDPDRFRRDTGYMFNALMDARSDKRAIFVVEDAGDLLTFNNGARDGLSALLNVTDGAVGQGMRTMFLFTTNLPLARIHPALTRTGRCSASIEFEPFAASRARTWLRERGTATKVGGEVVLCDLFGAINGTPVPAPDSGANYL